MTGADGLRGHVAGKAASAPSGRRSGAAMAAAPAPWMAARRPVDICIIGLKAAAVPRNARATNLVVYMLD